MSTTGNMVVLSIQTPLSPTAMNNLVALSLLNNIVESKGEQYCLSTHDNNDVVQALLRQQPCNNLWNFEMCSIFSYMHFVLFFPINYYFHCIRFSFVKYTSLAFSHLPLYLLLRTKTFTCHSCRYYSMQEV